MNNYSFELSELDYIMIDPHFTLHFDDHEPIIFSMNDILNQYEVDDHTSLSEASEAIFSMIQEEWCSPLMHLRDSIDIASASNVDEFDTWIKSIVANELINYLREYL